MARPRKLSEVGSIRPEPVGGGLGVYGQMPDRTVSGNERIVVAHWGAKASKKWQKSVINITYHYEMFRDVMAI
jgi:hypothetical protein